MSLAKAPLWCLLVAASLAPGLVAAKAQAADSSSRVLAVGDNLSVDPRLAPLQYAEADAEKFARAVAAAGDSPTVEVERSPTVAEFKVKMAAAVAASDDLARLGQPLSRFVFYFSGHADERGLHFKDGILSRHQLHDWLSTITAQTKLIVIDSCFAGSVAAKGTEPAAAFALPRLNVDDLAGTVYLTASSAREVAYESDELGGSVFTHFLVTGLSGGADANADALVTVEELYQFVYREMQIRNLSMPAAQMQRPEIHMDLHGHGAMVVARPQEFQGHLLVDPGILGTIELGSLSGLGTLKVYSGGVAPSLINLPSGPYRAVILRGNRVGEATVHVAREGTVKLLAGDFSWHDIDGTPGVTKGGEYAASTITAMAGLRFVNDRASSRGPEIDIANDIGRIPGVGLNAKVFTMATLEQAEGETADAKVQSMGGSLGLGLTAARPFRPSPRLLLGFRETLEWQTLHVDERKDIYFVPHSTVMVGTSFDLSAVPEAKSLALRYDSSAAKDQLTGRLERRDCYVVGIGFKP